MADTKTPRPSGQIEDDMGIFTWFMDGDRVMVKAGNQDDSASIEINRVAYRGDAHVRLENGKWTAKYNEIWLRRVADFMTDPTQAAWTAFRNKVEDLAASVATPENRRQARIHDLENEIVDSQEKIESLQEDIASEEGTIWTCKEKLAELSERGLDAIKG